MAGGPGPERGGHAPEPAGQDARGRSCQVRRPSDIPLDTLVALKAPTSATCVVARSPRIQAPLWVHCMEEHS